MRSRYTSKDVAWRNFIATTLFCLFVSCVTYSVWGGHAYVHVTTSFGYGYAAILSSVVLTRIFPNIHTGIETIFSLSLGVIFGSINAWFWLNSYMGSNFSDLLPVILLGIIFSAMCFYYFYNREQQAIAGKLLEETKRKQAEQEKALILSQLKQMQSQIEPHFLFNTLANISALMSDDVAKARMMLDKLTELLRTTLTNSRSAETVVQNEVRLLEAYFAIQKVRLDTRLEYQIQVAPNAMHAVIPPMLIQPLVENAIRHGIEPKSTGGNIDVEIAYQADQLVIKVQDNGIGLDENAQTKGHGMGLSNIRQRIKGLYHNAATMSVTQPDSGGFCVTIALPAQAPRVNQPAISA
ncbi:sensor histidine kinase [Vibrio taketomensis]|uniref:sensor histidine kinase n=1 Tax=Vibrio taketomensis TaxID=2572923 RepID=UPI00138A17F9|nr:histidine kinase [Vibrio taketomensis]